ncbi:MAG: hypothetical protein JJ916_04120 [Phycisphaerales bacterium]|nr:hypothetical protein [Phycisphaerales bacterium]
MSKHTTDQNAELRERAENPTSLSYGELRALAGDLLAALSTTEERLREKEAIVERLPKYKHPMQAIAKDEHGTMRFVENRIVRQLLDFASVRGCDLNALAGMNFEHNDWRQFAQLIGYSVDGFFTLSYVNNTFHIDELDDGFWDYAEQHCEAALSAQQSRPTEGAESGGGR